MERGNQTVCTKFKGFLPEIEDKYDERFIQLGLDLSEFTMQQESGVLKTLKDLPKGSDFLGEALSAKYMNFYDLYIRPTTPWKLRCDDVSGVKRKIIDLLVDADTSGLDIQPQLR